ncbi:transglutaminaseTgpA domain-containing protein [Dactylosporangium sp. NPDC048998]|uniref:transglutaminase family protein n=1 Tax=Dactylosporangium sp. NPDC048998 TaxID=3363976 RepID=UPI003722E4E4
MNQRKHLTLIAAGSAFLASLPLINVFEHYTWAIRAFLIVAVMSGVGLLVRSLRAPAWAPTAAMAASGLLALTWLYRSHEEYLGILPSPGTLAHFGQLLRTASEEMSEYATPVGDREGFLFLATLGVGAVALVVDLFAVVVRRPALAGLPMLAIYSVPVTVDTESTSWLPFALGAIGFLWLLVTDNVDRVRRFGRRFTGDGRDVDLWEPSPLAAAGQRLGALSVLAAVLVPLVPFAMPSGILDSLGAGAGAGGGAGIGNGRNGKSVSMFALLSGQLNRTKAFEMVKVTNIDDDHPFYLRFNVLEELSAKGFSAKPIAGGAPVGNGFGRPEWGPSLKASTHQARIEVSNELAINFLPIYTWPAKVDKVSNSWAFDPRTAVVYSNKETTAKKSYNVTYLRPDITPDQLRAADPINANDPQLKDLATAPPNAVVKSKVEELIKGKTNEYDRVKAIYDFFSPDNGFTYDTTTGADTSGTKIADFLQNKKGYCAQYAAAFGWLLREAKIPARVAFGFARGGTTSGKTMTLTNFNLHAWTEVYFPGFGWLPFDATPSTAIGGSVQTSYLPTADTVTGNDDPNRPGNNPHAPSSESAAPTAPDTHNNPGDTSGQPLGGDLTLVARALNAVTSTVGVTLLSIALLALVLATPALARARTRRRRLTSATDGTVVGTPVPGDGPTMVVVPNDDRSIVAARADAHRAWDELIDTMIDYRVPIDDAETPRATVDRLVKKQRLRDQAEAGARLLSTVEEHARYARAPLTGRELRSALSAVESSFAAGATRKIQLMARLLPPSVLRRWRTTFSARSNALTLALGHGWDSLMRTVSVRRLVARRAGR